MARPRKAIGERRTRAEAIRRLLSALPHLAALAEAERRASAARRPADASGRLGAKRSRDFRPRRFG